MANPKVVDDGDAAADSILARLSSAEPEGGGEGKPPDTEVPATPPAQPSGEPAPGGGTADARIAELQRQLEYERHRNDSLQGRIDSQLRPAHQRIKELEARFDALERKAAEDKTPKGPAYAKHLKPEEVEAVGSAALDVQARAARGEVEAATAPLAAEIEQMKREAREREQAQKEADAAAQVESIWDRVEALNPGARAINASDSRWYEFLNSVDPESGVPYRRIGEGAMSVGDARRISQLIDAFRTKVGLAKPEAKAAIAAAVDGQVRPGGPKGGATPRETPPGSPSKPVIRQSAVKRFYDDYARGLYRGREEEAKKIEAQIDAAVAEGRVGPG